MALVAGFIDAVAGGGGMLTIPALLAAGIPPHIALGTNKLAASFASATAALTFYKKKLFSPTYWKNAFLSTLSGAVIGTLLLNIIAADWITKALPIVIFAVVIYTYKHKPSRFAQDHFPAKDSMQHKQKLQGTILGFYDGAIGPGTGAFWVTSTMSLYKVNMLLATGVAKAMNFTSNITSLITFAILGQVNWQLGLTMGGCLMLGAYVGAHSAIHFGARFIRPIFITVVSIMAIKLAYQAWFVIEPTS